MPVNQKKKILDQNFKGTSIKSGTGTGTKTNLESSCVYILPGESRLCLSLGQCRRKEFDWFWDLDRHQH